MAQNITLLGANYPDVPAVTLPITGGGMATFSDTRSVTYNLTGGASASVTPSEVVAGHGFSVKLKAPAGYNLNGVTVTMGGVDITSQVFRGDTGGAEPALDVKTITANGTYTASDDDLDGYSEVTVNCPSKNVQVVQGTTRTKSSSMTAIGAEMTVSKTGTYDVYWTGVRTSTSGSYTYATQLYIDSVAYGSENATWSNHVQNVHLSNVSLTAGQKLRVYGRESRNSSYYMYAGTLIIVEA